MNAPRHVYLHVPFCARRCSYCDFSIAVRREVPVDEYLNALRGELATRFGGSPAHEVDTIYLGGGTPSRLGGDGVARALDLLRQRFSLARDAEVTIEANPEDFSGDAVARWGDAGINRVSLGAQSFDPRVLEWMHRTHDVDAIERAVALAREGGIENLSLDLIFALPEALKRDFAGDLERLLSLRPDHVSLYGLTIEPHTPLGHWVTRGVTVEQPEEGYEDDFLSAHRVLTAAGFTHYEVSNFARAGRRSRHNSAYWTGVSYLGLGPAAHGFDGDTRRANLRHYAEWRDAASSNTDPLSTTELLTSENRIAESVYLGLRTVDGLAFQSSDSSVVDPWVKSGWVTVDHDRKIRCTADGWLRLDALASALTHHRSR